MMDKIRMHKPADSFYFSECNAEPYLKSFDGFLTWMWVRDGEVPAFSAIYAGYTQMLGRCTIGRKKEDFDFFKYCTAKSLLYGQQLGWCKADVLFDTDRRCPTSNSWYSCATNTPPCFGALVCSVPPS